MTEDRAFRAATWALSDTPAAPPGYPMMLTSTDYLPDEMTLALPRLEEMPAGDRGHEIPVSRDYGLVLRRDRVRLCAVGELAGTDDRRRWLWPITDLSWVEPPDRRWYEQAVGVGSVFLGAYRDIFLAAHMSSHSAERSRSNVRLLRECRFTVVNVFTDRDVTALRDLA